MKNAVILAMMVVVGVAIGLGLRLKFREPKKTADNKSSEAMWNGGKARGPAAIASGSDEARAVLAGVEQAVEIKLNLPSDCTGMVASVRGVDGVRVVRAERFDFSSCGGHENESLGATIELQPGADGYVVVDLAYEFKGRSFSETRSLRVFDKKAPARKPVSYPRDSQGQALHVSKAVNP